MIIFCLLAGEAYKELELQWNARTEPLKHWNSSDSCTDFVALDFFLFPNVCKLTKIKGFFDYLSKLYLYVTCFQKEK